MKITFLGTACIAGFCALIASLQANSVDWSESNTKNAFTAPAHYNGELELNETPTPRKERTAILSSAPEPSGPALRSASASSSPGLSSYHPEIQNIVRACDGDIYKIFDLIRNHVEFQPYFGFRKSPEHTWQTRSGNDADQAFLLVECLRAAGYDADFEYGVVFIPQAEALAWFDADNVAGMGGITGSSGYFGGNADPFYAVEQIWCVVVIDGVFHELAPAYKEHETFAGIDLGSAMNYTQAGLLTAAGGVETATYAQGVSEPLVNDYFVDRASDLVTTLQTTHPTASTVEITGGRQILETSLEADFSNGFYADGSFISGSFDAFVFDDPYADYTFGGTPYSFYAFMSFAVGETNASGTGFIASPFIISAGPTGFYTGRKMSVTFDDDLKAEFRLDDVLIEAETATPLPTNIGFAYNIQHPYDRSAGTIYDELRVRPIQRGRAYTYVYEAGRSGQNAVTHQRKRQLEAYKRAGLTANDPEVLTETLNLLGLDWVRQFSLAAEITAERRNFVNILHHALVLVQQEGGFGVDIPFTAVPIAKDGTTTDPAKNIRALLMVGSAMEHSVLEQNYPVNGVSTVRYVRENNLLGNKTYYATSANYSTIETDPEFIAGWSFGFRASVFPSALSSGDSLIIPESGAIIIDDLIGNGYFTFNDNNSGAIINPGSYKGGFSSTETFIDFDDSSFPTDPTPGPDNQDNIESKEPIDMLTGAYVYDGTDLSLSGNGVRGLAFTRNYSSLAAASNKGLGLGWSHNYLSSIIEHTDVGAALGESTPAHAASLLVAIHTIGDLVDLPTSPKAWLIASLAAYWGMEEIEDNTVTVAMGRKTLPFTKLADGSYLPPAGMTATLTQDAIDDTYTLEERFDVVADFNTDGKLASITDADGKQMTFAYVASGAGVGQLESVTDTYGRSLTFSYTGDLLTQVWDSTGRNVTLGYTGDLLTSVADPETHTVQYQYDSDNRIDTVINKNGETLAENTYDDLGRMCFQVAEGDTAQEWEYAFTGTLNVEINPDDEFMSYFHNEQGLPFKTINGEGDETQMVYDGQNQLVRMIDGRSNITRFEYDGRNNLRFTYDARNGATGTTYKIERQYDAEDRLTKVIDEEGNETVYAYDPEHHLITFTDEILRQTSYSYYSSGPHDGMVETVTRPDSTLGQNQVTTYLYDANGYPGTATRPDSSVLTQTFNSRGDLLFSEITTAGEINTYPLTNTYDLNRRLLTSRDSLNYGTTMAYDAVGNLNFVTDRFSNSSSSTHSPFSRLESSTDSSGETTFYQYDNSGRNSQITNALNQTANLAYDKANRLKMTVNPMTEAVTQGYDATGNNTDLTNARSNLYQFTYNENNLKETLTTPLNRMIEFDYDDRLLLASIEEPSNQTIAYSYYDDELLESITDPTGTINFAYNARGRIDTVTEGILTISRTYDSLNRVTSFTDSAGNTIGYAYDGGSNLVTLTYPASKGDVDYEYDDAGRLTTVTDWANRDTEFIYDENSRLSEIRYPNGTKREFTYDFAGRITRQTDSHIANSTVLLDQEYSYDPLNRIVQEIVTPEPTPYMIDPTLLTYDIDDRIASWQSGMTTINPIFDLDGNMTSGPLEGATKTFVYDSRNRLTQAGTATYSYDAEDRRISKTEGPVATTYVHDPHAPISQLLQKTTGSTTTYYVYAGGQLLYEEVGGQITVYHFDSRGSTRALTDNSGDVVNRITYGTYGEVVSATAPITTPFLYNGAYGVQTDDNGLLQMRARYYSTDLRRFINADPIGFSGGMNWYAYAGGNPIGRIDPFGLDWLDTAANFSAGFGDAVSFGLTRVIRDNISFYDGSVDYSASSYSAGEYTAVAADIVTTGGAKTLSKAAAKKTTKQLQKQLAKDRKRAREVLDLVKNDGNFAHHVNPLKGHPGGKKALFPTAGLPDAIRNSKLNLQALKHAEHIQAHRNLVQYENLARRLGIANPFVTTLRTASVLK